MISHILVAIDQSTVNHRAFETALGMAKDLGAELTLVHALDVFDRASPQQPRVLVNGYSMDLDRLLRESYERQWAEFVDHYESLLKQKQEEARAIDVPANYRQPYGRPGAAICQAAKEVHADLIIAGSHGRKGLSEMILGSVSNYIMHHAPCSVMVIHPDNQRNHTPLRASSERNTAEMS
ncbi:MAG: universal stress protein [Leptolyngbya sp. SIO1E4]|nr:universal stress protein [Leptolyngbya sp. SIO1E4]